MSWTANISGHIQGAEEEARRLEEELVTEVEAIVRKVFASHGVASASFSGQYTGHRDLTSQARAERAPNQDPSQSG